LLIAAVIWSWKTTKHEWRDRFGFKQQHSRRSLGRRGSTSGTSGGTSTGSASASPFVINVVYDSSVNNAPAAFKADVAAAVSFFETHFTDHVTLNIDVGYGEVGGYTLGSGALGESLTYLSNYSYSQIKNALAADATTADDTAAVGSLSATSPVNGNFWTIRGTHHECHPRHLCRRVGVGRMGASVKA
jgi:hypothetical protein